MINVVGRGERGPGFHWQDVTRLRCYCADLTPLEIIQEGEAESNLQLHQAGADGAPASCQVKLLCSKPATYFIYI